MSFPSLTFSGVEIKQYTAKCCDGVNDTLASLRDGVKERVKFSNNGTLPAVVGHDWTSPTYILNLEPETAGGTTSTTDCYLRADAWRQWLAECYYWLKTSSYLFNKSNFWINTEDIPDADLTGFASVVYLSASDFDPDYTWYNQAFQSSGGHTWTMGPSGTNGGTMSYGELVPALDSALHVKVLETDKTTFCDLINATADEMLELCQDLAAATKTYDSETQGSWAGTASGPASSNGNNISCLAAHYPSSGDYYHDGNTCGSLTPGELSARTGPNCSGSGELVAGPSYYASMFETAYAYVFSFSGSYSSIKTYAIFSKFNIGPNSTYTAPQQWPEAQENKYVNTGSSLSLTLGPGAGEGQSIIPTISTNGAGAGGRGSGWIATGAILVMKGSFVV